MYNILRKIIHKTSVNKQDEWTRHSSKYVRMLLSVSTITRHALFLLLYENEYI